MTRKRSVIKKKNAASNITKSDYDILRESNQHLVESLNDQIRCINVVCDMLVPYGDLTKMADGMADIISDVVVVDDTNAILVVEAFVHYLHGVAEGYRKLAQEIRTTVY